MNLPPCYGHFLRAAIPSQSQRNRRIHGATDGLRNIFQTHAFRRRAVNGLDQVAALDTGFRCRTIIHDTGYNRSFLAGTDIHANAGIRPGRLVRKSLELITIKIDTVLISQLLYDSFQRSVEEILLIDSAGEILLHHMKSAEKFDESYGCPRVIVKEAH